MRKHCFAECFLIHFEGIKSHEKKMTIFEFKLS